MNFYPFDTNDLESDREQRMPHKPNAIVAEQVRILLVEDDPSIRCLFEKILNLRGWHVLPVENASEAIEHWEEGDFDLIFMDLQLPHLNGLEATRIIRQLEVEKGKKHIPIVALTAWCRPEDRGYCMEAGMDDYLPKPIHKNELYSMVAKHLTKVG